MKNFENTDANRDQNTYLLRLYDTSDKETERLFAKSLQQEAERHVSLRLHSDSNFFKILPRIRHIVFQISTNSVRTCNSDDDLYVIVFWVYWTIFKITTCMMNVLQIYKTMTFCIYGSRSKRVSGEFEILYVVIFLNVEINLWSLLTPWYTRRMIIVSRSFIRSTISSHPYLH